MLDKLLVTTALTETWLDVERFQYTFLGEWCTLYSERDIWQQLNAKKIPYHWDDRIKLKKDHDYLKALYEKVLARVAQELNKIHNTNESVKYWRVIIGPWLITYIPIVFERWEALRAAFAGREKYFMALLEYDESSIIPKDFNDFIEKMQTDIWNYDLYLRIIKYQYSDLVNNISVGVYQSSAHNIRKNNSGNLKQKCISMADRFLKLLPTKEHVFFYHSYFSPLKLAALNLSLKQVPRMYVDEFNYKSHLEPNSLIRTCNLIVDQEGDAFECFLFENVIRDIPLTYLETFREIRLFVKAISTKAKLILTANAYWNNDAFKIWIADQRTLGKKLLVSQHGGSFPPLFDTFQHEEDVSDNYITWYKPFHANQTQLPPNKIIKNKAQSGGKACSVIGFEAPRYSYRATAGPISHQVIDCFNHTSKFCDSLNNDIKSELKIRPYPDLGWETKQRYIDRFGMEALAASQSYKTFVRNSRLLVCTYPQTTFSEAIASGTPTILVYKSEYFELVPEADELLNILKEANIIFTDPVKAADHVNKTWEGIDQWWHSDKVEKAKQAYFDIALRINEDWKSEWLLFLRKI